MAPAHEGLGPPGHRGGAVEDRLADDEHEPERPAPGGGEEHEETEDEPGDGHPGEQEEGPRDERAGRHRPGRDHLELHPLQLGEPQAPCARVRRFRHRAPRAPTGNHPPVPSRRRRATRTSLASPSPARSRARAPNVPSAPSSLKPARSPHPTNTCAPGRVWTLPRAPACRGVRGWRGWRFRVTDLACSSTFGTSPATPSRSDSRPPRCRTP